MTLEITREQHTQYTAALAGFKKDLQKAYGGADPQPIDKIVRQLATAAKAFVDTQSNNGVSLADRSAAPRPASSGPLLFTNDPIFWYWLGRSHGTPHYYGRGCCAPARAPSAPSCFSSSGSGNRDNSKVVLALVAVGVVFTDVIALAAGITVTVIDSKAAALANKNKALYKEIARDLKGEHEGFNKDTTAALREIGTHLENVGTREAKTRTIKAIGTAFLATAGVGLVHAIVSAIACACLKSYMVIGASTSLIKAFGFFSASCCPPVLCALAAIAAIGILFYVINKVNQKKKEQADRLESMHGLNLLQGLPLRMVAKPYVPAVEGDNKARNDHVSTETEQHAQAAPLMLQANAPENEGAGAGVSVEGHGAEGNSTAADNSTEVQPGMEPRHEAVDEPGASAPPMSQVMHGEPAVMASAPGGPGEPQQI